MSEEYNRIETVKVSKEFKGVMGSMWLWLEAEVVVANDEDVINEFKKRNELLEKAWMAMNPQINWHDTNGIISVNNPDFSPTEKLTNEERKNQTIQSHIKTINECKTLNNLKIFSTLAENNPEIKEAYELKLQSLQK